MSSRFFAAFGCRYHSSSRALNKAKSPSNNRGFCYLPTQYRNFTSSVGSSEAAAASAHSQAANVEQQPLMRSDTFVRLLSSLNDKNSGFMLALKKFKDEIQAEGERCYPFRIRDLRVLVEFCSHLLTMDKGSQSSDMLYGALDLFNKDGDSIHGFDLCRLFSSLNNCHGKTMTSSIFQRAINNNIGMMAARFVAPKKLDKLKETYSSGAEHALRYIYNSLSEGDMEGLEECCDGNLFEFMKRGKGYLDSMGLKLRLELADVKRTRLDKFLLTIGGKRGHKIDEPFVMKEAIAHQIVVGIPKEPNTIEGPVSEEGIPLSRQQSRELVFQTFEKGMVARMEVLLTVRQTLTLLDRSDNVVWNDTRKVCTHKITFESEIELKSSDGEEFDTKDWIVVDINGVLNCNAPFMVQGT
ncbi:hypothetical protein BgAZ_108890 [Babesia gibsoni]|uniref:Uncharacterized protein n=1 Tax=Babesia gibsoni TaxID=33632 RepID=A0AAD8PGC7_BABGI|nr:hypothetical protein BgAZ_108890 [Babesia gibsoni]